MSCIMALEAHLQQAFLPKKVIDAMKDLCSRTPWFTKARFARLRLDRE